MYSSINDAREDITRLASMHFAPLNITIDSYEWEGITTIVVKCVNYTVYSVDLTTHENTVHHITAGAEWTYTRQTVMRGIIHVNKTNLMMLEQCQKIQKLEAENATLREYITALEASPWPGLEYMRVKQHFEDIVEYSLFSKI